MWFCRKSIIVRLTVCSSRSGPAGRQAAVTATSALCSATAPGPGGHGTDSAGGTNSRQQTAVGTHDRPHGDQHGSKWAPGANLTHTAWRQAEAPRCIYGKFKTRR